MLWGAVIGLALFFVFTVLFFMASNRQLETLRGGQWLQAMKVLALFRIWSSVMLLGLLGGLYLGISLYGDHLPWVTLGYLAALFFALLISHRVLRRQLLRRMLPERFVDGVLAARHLLYLGLASLVGAMVVPILLPI